MWDRIRKAQREDPGFTLIELLVVVLIIGILAGIAIPVFLEQQARARESVVHAELRNASIAQQTYSIANATYTTDVGDLEGAGLRTSADVTLTVQSADVAGYCMEASHDNSTTTWYFSSANGQPREGTCP